MYVFVSKSLFIVHCIVRRNTHLIDVKGRIPKKLSTVLVNMVLSPLTPLPQKGLVNRTIVKFGKVFYPPTLCHDREK